MDAMTTKQLDVVREDIAKNCGLECGKDVRCYHCQNWGYNHGRAMNDVGESRCSVRKDKTASYQWCKHFQYLPTERTFKTLRES